MAIAALLSLVVSCSFFGFADLIESASSELQGIDRIGMGSNCVAVSLMAVDSGRVAKQPRFFSSWSP